MHLLLNSIKCSACGKCASVCIRDNLKLVGDHIEETGGNCFDCGQCMAVCKEDAIRLKAYENQEDRIEDYNPKDYE